MKPEDAPPDPHKPVEKNGPEFPEAMSSIYELDLDEASLLGALESVDGLTPEQLQSAADAFLVHSLLLHESGALEDSTERALQATLSALHTDSETSSTASTSIMARETVVASQSHNRWWNRSSTRMAVAASILFILLTFSWQMRLPNAKTLLAQAYQSSLSNLDREYHLTLKRGELETEGTIIVRGNRAFLLQVKSIAGLQTFGRNDKDYWFAAPIGPVLKSDSRFFIASMLHQHSGGLPYLDPATVIQRLQEGYSLQRDMIEDPQIERTSYRIIATNQADSSDFLRPDKVTLWIDLENSRVTRMVLERTAKQQGTDNHNPSIFDGTLSIDYVTESNLPEEFYQAETQYPERAILSRPWAAESP
jgi:hypothetical protein